MHYFGPGPAALPKTVTDAAADAVLQYADTGISILSLAHRSPQFGAILEDANSLVNTLCDLRDEYHILWLPGGGRAQFAMLPMNALSETKEERRKTKEETPNAQRLIPNDKTAAYIDSGYWAHDALQTARTVGEVAVIASSREVVYRALPDISSLEFPPNTVYLHQTTNNTIFGTQFLQPLPPVSVPLVADMSSDILGVPRDYRQYALFYAVAQKNLGAAGVTLVCIRKDFLPKMADGLPPFLSYKAHVAAGGVLNTLPVFNIYTCLLMLRWTAAQGLQNLFQTNARKAEMLYRALDESPHFTAPVEKDSRSRMNVIFRGNTPEIEAAFLHHCTARGLSGIEGHRSAGSFRASLYNGVAEESVAALVAAIRDFDSTFAG